jgi:hypothetical protein
LIFADHKAPKLDLLAVLAEAAHCRQIVAEVAACYDLSMKPRSVRPASRSGLSHQALDELKRSIALAVVRQFTSNEIRAQILINLHRWRQQGAWVSACTEWQDIAERGDDRELFAAMLGRDDNATRLRQSMPFVGLLSQEELRHLREAVAG